jgi:2-oxoglutarate ferredoxin oxidoreductase subunit beta
MHAANRGENITVIFINNTNYGMTGGQMAPTTLPGQKTTTSPLGRSPATEGYPMKMAELMANLEAVKYSVRTHVGDPNGVMKTKAALKKAISAQMNGEGYCFVEVLSNCSTNWGIEPREANKYMIDTVAKTFSLGVIKDTLAKKSGGES